MSSQQPNIGAALLSGFFLILAIIALIRQFNDGGSVVPFVAFMVAGMYFARKVNS